MGDRWAAIAEGQPASHSIWVVGKRAIRMAGGDRKAIEHSSARHIRPSDDMIAIVAPGWVVYSHRSSIVAQQVAAEDGDVRSRVSVVERGLSATEAAVDR